MTAEREMINLKLRNMQSGYHQVITVAAELVQSLAACIRGEKITPAYLADIARRLSALRKNPPPISAQQSNLQEENKIFKPVIPPVNYTEVNILQKLNYDKIRKILSQISREQEIINTQSNIIQAFRMILTTASSRVSRREKLGFLISNDFLGLQKELVRLCKRNIRVLLAY